MHKSSLIKTVNRSNNFDFLRFLFAIFVVVSHSYPLSGISGSNEWIYRITKGQVYLSDLGLNGFFVISGFFIYKSFLRSEGYLVYLRKRLLRLFPALFVVLIVSLIAVLFVYNASYVGVPWYKNTSFYSYIPNNLSLYGFQGVITGVFESNPYHAINGSLWTLRYEFSLYICIAFLFVIKQKPLLIKSVLGIIVIFMLTIYLFFLERFRGSSILGMQGLHILNLGGFFMVGSLLAALNFDKVRSKYLVLPGISFLVFLSLYFEVFQYTKHVLLSLFILLLGFCRLPWISSFGKIGDLSYGVYIYSFVIQQLLMYYFKFSTLQLVFWSIALSIVFGFLSWHLIEKKALQYKTKKT